MRYGGKVEEYDMDGRGTPKRGEGPITYLIYELLYQTWERGRKLKVGN